MAKIRNNCYNKMIDAKLEIKGWPYWRPAPVFFNNQYCYKNIYYFRQQFITQKKKLFVVFMLKPKFAKQIFWSKYFFKRMCQHRDFFFHKYGSGNDKLSNFLWKTLFLNRKHECGRTLRRMNKLKYRSSCAVYKVSE